jgi:hypothetical protein
MVMKEHIELLVHLYNWYQNKYNTNEIIKYELINNRKLNRDVILEYLTTDDNFPTWLEWNGDRLKREWLENNGKTY